MKRIALLGLCTAAALALTGCEPSPHDIAASGGLERLQTMAAANPEVIHARNGMEKTPLHYAVTQRRTEVIAFLIEQGADIDATDITGMTPLHVATIQHAPDHRDEVKQLLEAGADIEAKDHFGDTPLHSAAMHGKYQILRYLLREGADPAATNKEALTPLELARKYRRTKIVEYLEKLDKDS